jgi:hypothetical protein
MRSSARSFFLHQELSAFEGDREVFAARWDREIPRDLA